MTTYAWTITAGGASIPGAANQSTVNVVSPSGCNTSYVLSLTITDANNCQSTCSQTVIVDDVTKPLVSCPTGIPPSVNVNDGLTYIHSDNLWDATATDNCALTSITAVLSGNTNSGPHSTLNGITFNQGTTTVTWTATDACGNSLTCTFDVVVIGAADLEITKTGAATAAVGNLFTYTINVKNLGPGPAPVVTVNDDVPAGFTNPEFSIDGGTNWNTWTGSYILPAALPFPGQITILLRGAPDCSAIGNLSNTATVALSPITDPDPDNNISTWVTVVSDITKPTFTTPTSFDFCVEDITIAIVNPNPNTAIVPEYDDLTTPRPEYYLFTLGNTIFDLDSIDNNFDDNCCFDKTLIPHWRIEFSPTPNPATVLHEPITKPEILDQIGNPSTYGNIEFPGDGVTFNETVHYLYYRLVDCHGNPSAEQMVPVTIIPRPNIIKQ
jgi:uncharacterized repeat protein (TIGR01451 family)